MGYGLWVRLLKTHNPKPITSTHNSPASSSANFRALEADLDAVDLLDAALDSTRLEVETFRHIDAMDVHDGVVAALGEDVDQHRQRQRVIEDCVFSIDVRDARDRMP